MESQTNTIKQLKSQFPTVPEERITRCLRRFKGDIKRVEEKLKSKTAQALEVTNKYNLKQDDIQQLCELFADLKLKDIIKEIEVSKGDLTQIKTNLGERQEKRGRHRGHYRRGEKVEEKMDVDIAALVGEYQKLYPNVPEERIKKIAERSCSKLRNIERKIQTKGKYQSSKSENEGERSRSRRHCRRGRGGKVEVPRPGNFSELLTALQTQFPDIEQRKLAKILERNQFNPAQAAEKVTHRLHHKKHREGKEDELLLKEIPSSVSRVIVDGNNLLFVNELIRGITIRSGMTRGTEALSTLISAYNRVENRIILVVYDEFHGKMSFENLQIDVARPKFKTSDDYLVNLSESMNEEGKENSLFVTSDIGLQQRLKSNGVKNIMKSGKFVKLCESKVENLGELLNNK